jgi:hypothetical protein
MPDRARLQRDLEIAKTVAYEAIRLLTDDQRQELRRILGGQASGEELTRVYVAPTLDGEGGGDLT